MAAKHRPKSERGIRTQQTLVKPVLESLNLDESARLVAEKAS
jgi:hypothetical protein